MVRPVQCLPIEEDTTMTALWLRTPVGYCFAGLVMAAILMLIG
jgi:hypothetical protein